MTLTIGIPSKGVDASLLRVISHAQTLDVDEILVGINPGNSSQMLLEHSNDSRIKVFYHNRDLGLYGNFRFLALNAGSTFFAWFCTDDLLSPDIPNVVSKFITTNVNLIIPTWSWVEYLPHRDLSFDLTSSIEGVYPDLETLKGTIDSALVSEPSWIFGVWRTAYLREIFPRRNFDWLDTYLLQRAMLSSKVVVLDVSNPTLIGTWNWAKKIPRPVSSRGHNPVLAILYQLRLLPDFFLKDPKSLRGIWLRIVFLIREARSLNRQLNEGRP